MSFIRSHGRHLTRTELFTLATPQYSFTKHWELVQAVHALHAFDEMYPFSIHKRDQIFHENERSGTRDNSAWLRRS